MSRFLRTISLTIAALALVSCATNFSQPRNLNDACSVVNERPKYLRAMRATERKWDIPVPVQMAIIYQESKFVGNIRTPVQYTLGVIPMGRQSSAYGYAQALDGTWDEYRVDQRKPRAKRTDIRDATDFMGWYMNQTKAETGVELGDARNQYLAYHEGRAGYLRGTYKRKSWLVRIADEVAQRAELYDQQLRACGKR